MLRQTRSNRRALSRRNLDSERAIRSVYRMSAVRAARFEPSFTCNIQRSLPQRTIGIGIELGIDAGRVPGRRDDLFISCGTISWPCEAPGAPWHIRKASPGIPGVAKTDLFLPTDRPGRIARRDVFGSTAGPNESKGTSHLVGLNHHRLINPQSRL